MRLKIIRNSLRNSFLICGYKFILVEYTYGYSVTPLVSSGQCRYGLWNNLFRLSDHAIVAAFFKFVQPWGGFPVTGSIRSSPLYHPFVLMSLYVGHHCCTITRAIPLCMIAFLMVSFRCRTS